MNTSHYPSLELCKKLTDLGFPETELNYYKQEDGKYVIGDMIDLDFLIEDKLFVCPSVMELLDEIPRLIEVDDLDGGLTKEDLYFRKTKIGKYVAKVTGTKEFGGTLPNALAEMYIWLKENNYIPNK